MPIQPPERKDEDVLTEIRERFTYATSAWEPIRAEGQKDIRFVAGEPWDPVDKKAREDDGRPCLSLDELGQYVNQTVNDVRQNKRAVNVTPIGNGATDKTAELRQNLIRQIEYRSNAQQQVYSPIFEDAVQRSYGYGRVKARYISDRSRDQELILEGFPNPDLVTVDPDGLAPDASDIQYAFIHESRDIKRFKRDFPDASITDFTDELRALAPDWVKGERINVAEYWTIEAVRRRVLFLKADPARGVFLDELEGVPKDTDIDDERWVDSPFVCQYLTNGVELLAKKGAKKRTPWPGKTIPIFACYGKTLYVNSGGKTERRLMSMIRLARDPYMLYCYYRTCQAELVGMTPKTPFIGYEGQFRGHETEWQESAHKPKAFLQARPTTEATGANILPLPERQPYDPPIQSLELGAESARRAIQAAMGTSPLPTQAQKQNEKSGKALRQIEESGQKGSYHFVDHYDGTITRVGAILDDLIPHYYDAARDITVREGDDQSAKVRINDPSDQESFDATTGDHDVTISVGPAYASQREASSEFADTIIGNPQLAQTVGPQKFSELIALAIRLKSVGPIGDEMADIIAPKQADGAEPPTPEQMAELQAAGQQLQQELQAAQQQIATDQAKQQAQVESARIKAGADIKKAELQIELQRMKNAAAIRIKEIDAEMKGLLIDHAAQHEAQALHQKQTHEAVQAAQGREHESAEAQAAREAADAQAEATRSHEAEQAEIARQAAAEQAAAEGASA